MYTGWGKYWGDRKRYLGTDEPGNVSDLHFPGFSKEAAEFLIKQRSVKAVGVDTPSIDYGQSRDFPAHQLFGAANVPIFENVAALERLPAKGATVFAIPMKIIRRQRRSAKDFCTASLSLFRPHDCNDAL